MTRLEVERWPLPLCPSPLIALVTPWANFVSRPFLQGHFLALPLTLLVLAKVPVHLLLGHAMFVPGVDR